ncbi:hypothetical protein C8J55DRAFT_486022 [Lentinula edodes]|uniref:F-box domain-containing protein n=1 Tax=Lentinula lateritia TaxID=40482 RepID=A0A9W9AY93_9AGAR|nr:hypothetical protein C8J55DRAFT_486022 [Lentinula edodes]
MASFSARLFPSLLQLSLLLNTIQARTLGILQPSRKINLDRCQNKLDCRVDVHETLEAHKQFLEAHIALISSLCSPIRKLPRELLEDIFEYVCCTGVGNHIAPGARYYRDQRRKVRSNVARLPTLDLCQISSSTGLQTRYQNTRYLCFSQKNTLIAGATLPYALYTTITHLAISHVSPGHAWVLISYCPNLKELLLKEIDISLSEDNALPLLYICNAQKLILEIPESAISNLLFSIDLPKVLCLELINSNKDSRSYSIELLARMLDRSSANNLTHLSLRYVSFSLDHLLPLFSCTPSITDLEVVEVMDQLRDVYPILKLLICEDGGGEPEDVVFEDREDIDQVNKAEDFIQPQSFYLQYPLRNLSLLETRAPRDLDALQRSLERFKKEGLNVQIGLAPSYNTTSAN